MKKIIILLFFFNQAHAQFLTKNDLVICSLSLVAGAANGVEEAIKFHYNKGFAFVHPYASRQFWDPRLSYINKDRSAFTRLIPTFSDGYHLMRGISRTLLIANVAISVTEMKAKNLLLKIAKKFVISMLANRAGQFLTYDLIYKKKK